MPYVSVVLMAEIVNAFKQLLVMAMLDTVEIMSLKLCVSTYVYLRKGPFPVDTHPKVRR